MATTRRRASLQSPAQQLVEAINSGEPGIVRAELVDNAIVEAPKKAEDELEIDPQLERKSRVQRVSLHSTMIEHLNASRDFDTFEDYYSAYIDHNTANFNRIKQTYIEQYKQEGWIVTGTTLSIQGRQLYMNFNCVEGDLIYSKRVEAEEAKRLKEEEKKKRPTVKAPKDMTALPKVLTEAQKRNLTYRQQDEYYNDRNSLVHMRRLAKKYNIPLPEEVWKA